jgi:UDP-3-O-[3-hydroxymyristoyl] glucosamine N-acyltransferase
MKLFEIARLLECELESAADIDIQRVAGIIEAEAGDLTFVSNRRYISHIKTTRASAIILGRDIPSASIPILRSDNPYLAFAKALELFYQPVRPVPGIDSSAHIAPDAEIGDDPSIGPGCVVQSGCRIGKNVILHPNVVIYPGAVIGHDVEIHSHAVVREFCVLGNRVVIQNGAVIGSDGFGFAPKPDGTYYKILQTGRVLIEDDVEIGSNTTIDRAAVGDTVIKKGAKLDNLVQVGHGATVGEHSVLAAQVGLAGSTRLGRNVKAGGQVGFAGHLEVGDDAVITAQSGTSHDVQPGEVLSGSPAFANRDWLRSVTAFPRLPTLMIRVRQLEKQLEALTARLEKFAAK